MFFLKYIAKIALLLLFISCQQEPSQIRDLNPKTSSSTNTINTPSSPDYPYILNYFQEGQVRTTSNLELLLRFKDSFYLRGAEVDDYISGDTEKNVLCMASYFPSSTINRLLVVAATPHSFYDLSKGIWEDYYLISPADGGRNQSFCQKSGLTTKLNTLHSGSSIAYTLETICPGCNINPLYSSKTYLFSSVGEEIININVNYLNLKVVDPNEPFTREGDSCSLTTECQSRGYDCCIFGQCAVNGAIRPGAENEADYYQAIQDVANNPAAMSNYPHIYFVCGNSSGVPDEDENTDDPSDTAEKRVLRLKELYNCTTLIDGESSVCTRTFTDYYPTRDGSLITPVDDRNFNTTRLGTTTLPSDSITAVYFDDTVLTEGSDYTISGGNDNLAGFVTLTLSNTRLTELSTSNYKIDVKIQYKIDGSCEIIGSSLARCSKYYIQGQDNSSAMDHFPASNNFLLPSYADLSRQIKVEVDGSTKYQGSDWELVGYEVQFIHPPITLNVLDTQKVKITFYSSNAANIFTSKLDALNEIDQICNCGGPVCTLSEKTKTVNGVEEVVDYNCVYPEPIDRTPTNVLVNLSSKTVPQRYFDNTGVYQSSFTIETPEQEKPLGLEGDPFRYTNNDKNKPNNTSEYKGMGEIYGPFDASNSNSSIPAQEVAVEKGRTYDIFVNTGNFSTCLNCGSDYYSNLARLFPLNFENKGGGYRPNLSETDPVNTEIYRRDELIFGRACFVPATMIPWSHAPHSDVQRQRLMRERTQHFLFANGYNRDWYGFDYGSVIGSFDGIFWFSVGNQRRIRAKSNKLFLAINAYYGDLTQESSYQVTVSDISLVPNAGPTVKTDYESDGAECQQFHTCEKDQDCIAQLGWEYSCEVVSSIRSNWPIFDDNAVEIGNSSVEERIASKIGSLVANGKRCVYRGKGSICEEDYEIGNKDNSYSKTDIPGLHACTNNYYCQTFQTGGGRSQKFNDKINRNARSVNYQNASNGTSYDSFGLGSPIIGRSQNYIGEEKINVEVQAQLGTNNVKALCLPGRNPFYFGQTVKEHNKSFGGAGYNGDLFAGIGMTPNLTTATREYLNSCAILDSDGDYYYKDSTKFANAQNIQELIDLAASQVIPTNSLSIFGTLLGFDLVKDFDVEQIIEPTIQQNRCLRGPGSVCHSNYDCAPSSNVSTFIDQINEDGVTATLNRYEVLFWQEGLICSQFYNEDDSRFALKNNKCCREIGKNITIPSLHVDATQTNPGVDPVNDPNFNHMSVPGVNIDLNNSLRYSRNGTVYDKTNTDAVNYPKLNEPIDDVCTAADTACLDINDNENVTNQWKSLHLYASRTCCSGHWVRNFDKDENGGGHEWTPSKMQDLTYQHFKCLNWEPCTAGTNCGTSPFTCDHTDEPDDAKCLARAVSLSEAKSVFAWMNSLEMLGVPQATIKTGEFEEVQCIVSPADQTVDNRGLAQPTTLGEEYFVKDIYGAANIAEFDDSSDPGKRYYSSTDADNFNSNLKKVFSEDEFSCCYPPGFQLDETDDDELCCTGFKNPSNNRCALKDYANVSLFFNRYISSIGSTLNDNLFDKTTGFMITGGETPFNLITAACELNVCASGYLAKGIALSYLKVPGHETSDKTIRQYLHTNSDVIVTENVDEFYDAGMRWNTNLYCIPENVAENVGGDQTKNLFIFNCNNTN